MKCQFLTEGNGLPECDFLKDSNSYCLSEFHYEEFCIQEAYKVCPYFIESLEEAMTIELKAA